MKPGSIAALALAAAVSSSALADTAATVAARSHFFGEDNVDQTTGAVDKEKVILSYFSVQSFAVAARGRVFLLDSYIYRLSDTPGYVPTTVQELVDLQPEAIFLGHGHGDHADNAAYIAVKTGATIFGAAEHCNAMRGDAERIFGAGTPVSCTSLTTLASPPGSEISDVKLMRPDICITAFKHLHSGAAPFDPNVPVVPIAPVRDPRVADLYPTQPPPTLNTRTVAGAGGSVSMCYQFTVGHFSFIWHDTNGPIRTGQPQLVPLAPAPAPGAGRGRPGEPVLPVHAGPSPLHLARHHRPDPHRPAAARAAHRRPAQGRRAARLAGEHRRDRQRHLRHRALHPAGEAEDLLRRPRRQLQYRRLAVLPPRAAPAA